MSNEYELNSAEKELERALGSLKPVIPKLERDRLMFRAGQASVERKDSFWRPLSGVLAAMLAITWTFRLQPATPNPAPQTAAGADAPGVELRESARLPIAAQEPAGENFWQWRKPVAKRSLDNLTQAQFGFHSGGVEVWRPFKPALSEDFESRM